MRFQSVPSLFPGSSTPCGRSNRLRQQSVLANTKMLKPHSGEAHIVTMWGVDEFVLLLANLR